MEPGFLSIRCEVIDVTFIRQAQYNIATVDNRQEEVLHEAVKERNALPFLNFFALLRQFEEEHHVRSVHGALRKVHRMLVQLVQAVLLHQEQHRLDVLGGTS